MPTYYVRVGHTRYHVEANDASGAKIVALDKYREQYPLRTKIRNPVKNIYVREANISPLAVSEARIARHYE